LFVSLLLGIGMEGLYNRHVMPNFQDII